VAHALAGACAVVIATTALAPGAADARGHASIVDVGVSATGRPVSSDFFGLSVEYTELADYESEGRAFDRMLSVMRPQDGRPLLFRLGGTTADEVYWNTPAPRPSFVSDLDPAWMNALGALARRDRLRVELTLNLAVHSPTMAVDFAQAAQNALPGHALAGLAIGNEPDLYKRQPRYQQERIPSTLPSTPTDWTDHYSPASYRSDYSTYASALHSAFPSVPLIAPELTFPSLTWPQELLNLGRLAPQILSFHRYAAATCTRGQRERAPTPVSFLSDRYSTGLAHSLNNDIAFAHSHGLQLRVSEINSVSCSRPGGVASSFSTALWALDTLFELMRAGVDGVNWHIRPDLPNSPFHVTATGVQALPELYALNVFGRMLGPRPRLVPTTVSPASSATLKAWALRSAAGLHVLLLNEGARPVRAIVAVPGARGPMLLSRLLAPGIAARAGITFAGQSIGSEGEWQRRFRLTKLHLNHGRLVVEVPPYSAALGRLR
jgi:hypothetical protein